MTTHATRPESALNMTNDLAPNFFIIGAAKAGTTSLSSMLSLHPEAAIVGDKEVHFFSSYYSRGWDAYLGLFSHCAGKKARGDASTSYSRIRYYPGVVERIHRHAPEAKIIYMVRHPLKRIESAYIEHLGTPTSQVYSSVNDAVERQPMIVDSSRYGEVYEAYRERFGESQIKIVWFEEYISKPHAVFQDVCRFLGISDQTVQNIPAESINSRGGVLGRLAWIGRGDVQVNTTWDDGTRRWVLNQLLDDNCRFLEQMRRPRNYWGNLF